MGRVQNQHTQRKLNIIFYEYNEWKFLKKKQKSVFLKNMQGAIFF